MKRPKRRRSFTRGFRCRNRVRLHRVAKHLGTNLKSVGGNASLKIINNRFSVFLVLASLLSQAAVQQAFSQRSTETALDGFNSERSAAERRWEEQFQAVPAPGSAREHLRRLTLEPHVAGTKEDYATAVYVRDQMRSYGLSAELKEYQVWLNYPKTDPIVELIAPRHERLSVREAVLKEDPSSSNPNITPLFNGYSASGD